MNDDEAEHKSTGKLCFRIYILRKFVDSGSVLMTEQAYSSTQDFKSFASSSVTYGVLMFIITAGIHDEVSQALLS